MRNRLLLLIIFAVACVLAFILFFLKTTDEALPRTGSDTQTITRDIRLAAGWRHSLFIDGKKQLWAWGDTYYRNRLSTVPVKVADNVCSVAAGDTSATSFYVTCDGTLYGWGDSRVGQIGLFSGAPVAEPVPIFQDVRTVVAGNNTPFAIDSHGTLWTWGETSPSRGEALPGDTIDGHTDERQKVMDLVQLVSASPTHTLALREDRSLWVWGKNDSGALATGSHTHQNRPYRADIAALFGEPIIKLATRDGSSYAVTENGSLYVWGHANATLPGRDSTVLESKTLPVKVDFIDDVADVALGERSVLILKKDGTVWAYGSGPVTGKPAGEWTPPVRLTDDVVEIASGPRHALVLKKDGTVWSWGENGSGELGDGTTRSGLSPKPVSAFPVAKTATSSSPTGFTGKVTR